MSVMEKASNRKTRRGSAKRMLSCFGIALAAVSLSATFVLDANVELRFPFAADLAKDYSSRQAPVVLALGSSRTEGSFEINRMNAYLLERYPEGGLTAFNAAVRSSGLFTQAAVLETLLRSGPKPELVIVEVNPEFVDRRDFWVKVGRDTKWSNLFDFHYRFLIRHPGRILENRLLPLYSMRYELRRAVWNRLYAKLGATPPKLDSLDLSVPTVKTDYVAAAPAKPVMTNDWRDRQHSGAHRQSFKDYTPTGVGAEALQRILTTCEANGLPVVMVEAPLSSHYREAFDPAQTEYRAFIASLLKRFPQSRYHDSIAALPDEAFKDAHHVNEYGEHLMCQHLSQVVVPEAFAALKPDAAAGGIAQRPERPTPGQGATR